MRIPSSSVLKLNKNTHDILQASPSASGNSALRCVPSSRATLLGHTLCSAALAQVSVTGSRALKRDSSVSSKTPRNHCSRREEDAPRERAASTLVPTTRRTRRVCLRPPLQVTVFPPSNIKLYIAAIPNDLMFRTLLLQTTRYPENCYSAVMYISPSPTSSAASFLFLSLYARQSKHKYLPKSAHLCG